ncbi:hypothetical protein [Microvirga guangxiensis]|uniref:Uncharacterized protein n=1 Tax=Microvirga guangxiensis TaxID=549386 RepID=A0A1G5C6J0_9HYPH|nr:hypothetical protein [Microvirga guangxiensis]SCX98099.1 hypothetical protein SAMN02927923_00469 [Microvirga guangxiensis]
MIIALLALAFAMIVGGLLAVFFGWEIVLIERGWTMVIAGSFSAACGALLLGITAAVSKLTGIQTELARLQVSFDEELREEAPTSSTGLSMAALAGGLLGGRMLGRSESKDQPEEKQPDLPLFGDDNRPDEPVLENREDREEPEAAKPSEPLVPFPPRTVAENVERRDEDLEVKVPDFLLADRLRDTYVETRTTPSETSFFDDEPKLDEPEDERRSELDRDDILEPAVEPVAEREPEPEFEPETEILLDEPVAEQASEEKAEEEPRSDAMIIGTYNSGDNTYVMFSDGSIEAQTPGGVFRFQSLDELKAFIASGGEGGSSAT